MTQAQHRVLPTAVCSYFASEVVTPSGKEVPCCGVSVATEIRSRVQARKLRLLRTTVGPLAGCMIVCGDGILSGAVRRALGEGVRIFTPFGREMLCGQLAHTGRRTEELWLFVRER